MRSALQSFRKENIRMAVFVLDRRGKPLMPCSSKRARLLLERQRAVVHRIKPFVIRLKDRRVEESVLQSMEVKIDPGSRRTGLALVRKDGDVVHIQKLLELNHRGLVIRTKLLKRRAYRSNRRSRKIRYRRPRFSNRTKPEGWLPPSLQHRVETTMTWVRRLKRWAPISSLAYESTTFDTQRLRNPEISGVDYQRGTLEGFEVRAYVFEKWNYQCAYCFSKNRLTLDHVIPRARGGSDAVTNLVCACHDCNQKKGSRNLEEFLSKLPALALTIRQQLRLSLRDAAVMNTTRLTLHRELLTTRLPVVTGSGARTAWNRKQLRLAKTHSLDAAIVGTVSSVTGSWLKEQKIFCRGRGRYQRTRTDRFGFPEVYMSRHKTHFGYKSGDIACLIGRTPSVIGMVVVRASGQFTLKTPALKCKLTHKRLRRLQPADGYGYV